MSAQPRRPVFPSTVSGRRHHNKPRTGSDTLSLTEIAAHKPAAPTQPQPHSADVKRIAIPIGVSVLLLMVLVLLVCVPVRVLGLVSGLALVEIKNECVLRVLRVLW